MHNGPAGGGAQFAAKTHARPDTRKGDNPTETSRADKDQPPNVLHGRNMEGTEPAAAAASHPTIARKRPPRTAIQSNAAPMGNRAGTVGTQAGSRTPHGTTQRVQAASRETTHEGPPQLAELRTRPWEDGQGRTNSERSGIRRGLIGLRGHVGDRPAATPPGIRRDGYGGRRPVSGTLPSPAATLTPCTAVASPAPHGWDRRLRPAAPTDHGNRRQWGLWPDCEHP